MAECVVYARLPVPLRAIPEGFTDEDRASFVLVGERAAVERVNSYTVACLGVAAFAASDFSNLSNSGRADTSASVQEPSGAH